MPLRLRHVYAADLRRGLPADDINRLRSSPIAGARRGPAQIRQVRAGGIRLRGVLPLVSIRTPSRLACRARTI
jgi:hypothetical protein